MNEKPISYERLLQIAQKMHLWIFLNRSDEQDIFDEIGLTDEENAILGYSGLYKVEAKMVGDNK